LRRFLMSLLVVLATALLVAACGSETNDYRGEVLKIQNKYQQQMTDLTTKVSTEISADPTTAGAVLTELATVVNQFADEVAAVKPPSDKQALADQLVGAYRTLAEAALNLKAAVETSDVTKLQEALGQFNEATVAESAAIDAFNAAE
jgi:hypothetical protein